MVAGHTARHLALTAEPSRCGNRRRWCRDEASLGHNPILVATDILASKGTGTETGTGRAAEHAVHTGQQVKQRKPIPKVRAKRRTHKLSVRLVGKAKERLRHECYLRAEGYCELKLAPDCAGWAGENTCGEMAHYPRSIGAGASDQLSDVKWSCRACHRWQHNGGKPVPAKDAP